MSNEVTPGLTHNSSYWISSNPILNNGQLGKELDTELFKVGDGMTSWINLPYLSQPISAVDTKFAVQFDKTNATLENIPNLSFALLSGKTYDFIAKIYLSEDNAGGGKFSVAGDGVLSATDIIYQINVINNGNNLNVLNTKILTLGSAAGNNGSPLAYAEITGTITVNIGGVISVQFAQNSPSGTSSVLRGSTFSIKLTK